MSRSLPPRRAVRPYLEHLETRDLPSTVGTELPYLVIPLTGLTKEMTADVQKMNTDFKQLQTDVASNSNDSSSSPQPPPAVAQDYVKVSNDLGQIQALATVISATVKTDEAVILIEASDGSLDQSDAFTVLEVFNSLNADKTTAANDLAQAMNLANTNPGYGEPTVNAAIQK